jgi:quercetin dioxygenase-like cupin family protein
LASPRRGGKEPALYRLSALKEEAMNPKIGRRIIVGENEMLGYFRIKKGGVVPPHHHLSEQITYVIKGALRFTINDKEIVVRTGEVLVIPPNLEHSVVALEDTTDLDSFSPLREDWLSGNDDYLRRKGK